MMRSDGRRLGIFRPVSGLFRQFVGQPPQQFSEWTGIFSGIVVALAVGFVLGVDPCNSHLGEVRVIFRNPLLILELLVA
jgi:hypothetical protein